MMASTPLASGVLVSIFVATASTTSPREWGPWGPTGSTPVTTCCPPGSFLAIEDWQGSRQGPDGIWKTSVDSKMTLRDSVLPQPTPKIKALTKLRRKWNRDYWYMLNYEYGRHNFINRVYCVPDKNNLPSIHKFQGSAYPRPPYWATSLDKLWSRKTFENFTWPLAENQTLYSQGKLSKKKEIVSNPWAGDKLPSCPGGPDELATIVLGDGLDHRDETMLKTCPIVRSFKRLQLKESPTILKAEGGWPSGWKVS